MLKRLEKNINSHYKGFMAKHVKRVEDKGVRRALQGALDAGAFALADSVRALRALHGLSQVELAEMLQLSVNVVKSIESGKGNPELVSLNKLAEFAGLRVALVRPSYEAVMFDPAERRLEEDQMRAANWAAIEAGEISERNLDRRNAMRFDDAEFELPELV